MSPYETITISYDVILDAGEHMNWVLSTENGKEYTLEGTGEITVPTEENLHFRKNCNYTNCLYTSLELSQSIQSNHKPQIRPSRASTGNTHYLQHAW